MLHQVQIILERNSTNSDCLLKLCILQSNEEIESIIGRVWYKNKTEFKNLSNYKSI